MLRKLGSEILGDTPWVTHLCQLYEIKEDLIAILVPYFAEGLSSYLLSYWLELWDLSFFYVFSIQNAIEDSVPKSRG